MRLRLTLISTVAIFPLSAFAGDPIALTFVDHIKAGMIEQDVFVDMKDDGKAFRVTTENYSDFMDTPVVRTVSMVEHAPGDIDKVGPYEAGPPLGFTLGEWLAATGTASYDCDGGKGVFKSEFEGLVPNGIYTMWNFYMGDPMPAKFHTYDMPMGARDGSESAFTADDAGNAVYEVALEPCLQGGGSQLAAGLAIAYHSDETTHGWTPGPMGNKSHVHLFTVLPSEAEMPH